jgi:hypothetical protein
MSVLLQILITICVVIVTACYTMSTILRVAEFAEIHREEPITEECKRMFS